MADTILGSEILNLKGKFGTIKRVYFSPILKIAWSHRVCHFQQWAKVVSVNCFKQYTQVVEKSNSKV